MPRSVTDELNAAYGRRMAAVREQTGLSQSAFGAKLGLSYRTYASYERGEREAPIAVHRALYETFGIDPVWLMSGNDLVPRSVSARAVDFKLVADVTQHLDRRLAAIGRTLTNEARFEVLAALYQLSLEHGAVSDEIVERLIGIGGTRA